MKSTLVTVALLLLDVEAAPAAHKFALQARSGSSPTVTIDSGVVIGLQSSVANSPNLVNKYLGVPFAASPTRFAPAQTPTPWSSPYHATQNGPACIQQFNYPEATRNFTMAAFNNPPPAESEDCLHVNVFTPASSGGKLKPVMFWIYGGSLQFGWNGQAAYDGSSFAANQDVVVVATNYRTNVFGFPSSPSLPLKARNLGYLDQRFALAWVKRNIAAFGGDPSRVTIFGESAGSFSVDALVTSFGPSAPDGPAPFHAAIMESGQSSVSAQYPPDPTTWTNLTAALNCTGQDDLACVRAAPAATIKSIIEHAVLSFRPARDNYTQLQYPEAARKAGNIAKVPVLTGTNANEGILFTFTQSDTVAFLKSQFNNALTDAQIQTILALYPIGQRGITSQTEQIAAIDTEVGFQCPCAIFANDSASAGTPTWRYYYNASFPEIQPLPGVSGFGAFHSSEIPIVFGTYSTYGQLPENGKRLSELMQNMWATFAKNPMGGPAPGWQRVDQGGAVEVIGGRDGLDSSGRLRREGSTTELDGGRCSLWRLAYGPL